MKVSDLIRALDVAKAQHGDLKVFTFDGAIKRFRLEPSIDGLDMIHAEGRAANELVLEVETL